MDTLKLQIIYEGQTFTFDDGLKAYIFHLGIQNGMYAEFGADVLMQFVDKVYQVAKYPGTTWVEDVAIHVAEYWEKLKDLDTEEVFDDFVENKEDF